MDRPILKSRKTVGNQWRIVIVIALISIFSGCSIKKQNFNINGNQVTVFDEDDYHTYLNTINIYSSNDQSRIRAFLSEQLAYRLDNSDIEGCLFAAGELYQYDLDANDYEAATKSLDQFRSCYIRMKKASLVEMYRKDKLEDCILPDNSNGEFYDNLDEFSETDKKSSQDLGPFKNCFERSDNETVAYLYLGKVEVNNIPSDELENSYTLSHSDASYVHRISNYFSPARPLEDYPAVGRDGHSDVFDYALGVLLLPVFLAGIPFILDAAESGKGLVRFERPQDPDSHLKKLAENMTEKIRKLKISKTTLGMHRKIISEFSEYRYFAKELKNHHVYLSFVTKDYKTLIKTLKENDYDFKELKSLNFLKRVVKTPRKVRRAALWAVEPAFFNYVSENRDKKSGYKLYFKIYKKHSNYKKVYSWYKTYLGDKAWPYYLEGPLEKWKEFITKHPTSNFVEKAEELILRSELDFKGFSYAYSIYQNNKDNKKGEITKAWLDEYVNYYVEVLGTDMAAARGDRSWVNDWVESTDGTFFANEKVNIFIFGAVGNYSDHEIPVEINCNLHTRLTIKARLLFVVSSESEDKERYEKFGMNLKPGEKQLFMCVFKNVGGGGGISAGIFGGGGFTTELRDPAYTIEASMATERISQSRISAQESLVKMVEENGNVKVKNSPMDEERFKSGASGTVHLDVTGLSKFKDGVEVSINDIHGYEITSATFYLGIIPEYEHVPPGKYIATSNSCRKTFPFEAYGRSTVVSLDAYRCEWKLTHHR